MGIHLLAQCGYLALAQMAQSSVFAPVMPCSQVRVSLTIYQLLMLDLYVPATPNGHANEEIFASPFMRQGSLISMEPVSSGEPPGCAPAEDAAARNGSGNIVYCPVGVTPQKHPKSGVGDLKEAAPDKAEAATGDVAGRLDGMVQMQPELQGEKGAPRSRQLSGISFSLGLVLGGTAGALLAYFAGFRRT
jgi:hypothetical protein